MSAEAVPAEARAAALRRRYLDAQLQGDRREALRLVLEDGVGRGLPVSVLQRLVIQAAQREVGVLWQQNRIGIAQEHMATAISQIVLSRLFEAATPAPRAGRRVIVACVEGEQHEFPARLVADFLELGGFDVIYLGSNVPTDDLLKMMRRERCHLLALSVTMSFNVAALGACVERVRVEWPTLPILAGGRALAWEPALARQFGVETSPPEAEALVATVGRLTGMA